MSGGSFNYLCYAEPGNLFEKYLDLAMMRDALAEDYPDAAKETESIVLICKQFDVLMQARLDRLSPVWKAVEWTQSGDTGPDAIKEAVAEYRKGCGAAGQGSRGAAGH